MQVARIVSTLTQDTSAPRGIVCRCVGNNLALIIPRRRRRWTAATAKPTPNHRLSSLRPSDGRSDLIHFGSRVYRRFRLIVLSYWDEVIVNFQTYKLQHQRLNNVRRTPIECDNAVRVTQCCRPGPPLPHCIPRI